MDPRWIIPFAANLLLLLIGRETNHYLAPYGVSVLICGLALPVTALRLTTRPGLLVMVLTGLAIDALNPVAFGSSALLLAAGLLTVHALRQRLVQDSFATHLLVAVSMNLVLFVAEPFSTTGIPAFRTPTLMRILVDLLLSQALVVVLAWWFFALQERALVLWGVNLAEESREHR